MPCFVDHINSAGCPSDIKAQWSMRIDTSPLLRITTTSGNLTWETIFGEFERDSGRIVPVELCKVLKVDASAICVQHFSIIKLIKLKVIAIE